MKTLGTYLGASVVFAFLLLCNLVAGCASTPEQRAADEQREANEEHQKMTEEQKRWERKLASYSDEQLYFKLETLEQAIARGKDGMNILLAQGNGIGVLIAQGQIEGKVKERDAVGLELVRRGGGPGNRSPRANGGENDGDAGRVKGSGTGFFITDNGYMVTCQHVVENASRIMVRTKESELPAKLIRMDKRNDLAILKVNGTFSALPVVSSSAVKLGQSVFTIGFPDPDMQGREPKFTRGEISSKTGIQDDPRVFQVSVAVQPGNSGGPLLDLAGSVVGVMVSRLNDSTTLKRTGSLPQNVNYAVKSSLVFTVLESVPEAVSNLKAPHTERERASDDAINAAQAGVALVLVY